jgi:CDP-2,3-bis-(O-geranylgeranyl)-sn-glycerol synthase
VARIGAFDGWVGAARRRAAWHIAGSGEDAMDPQTLLATLWFFLPAYVADMAPVLIGDRFASLARPIDGGRSWRGVRIFGAHKTWRGLVAGVVAGAAVGLVQEALSAAGLHVGPVLPAAVPSGAAGAALGLGAGVGDAVKSFLKRRAGIAPGGTWIPFDQLDFMAGAWLLVLPLAAPPALATLYALPVVFFGTIAVTAIGRGLGLKEAWV